MKYAWLLVIVLTAGPFHAVADLNVPDMDYNHTWARYLANHADTHPGTEYPFASCFQAAAKKYDVPYSLLLAVARGESFFDPKAVSRKKCYGVMQIKWPETAKHLGFKRRKDLLNPCKNIFAGAGYLRELLDRYDGNVHLALAAYNYGPGRISKKNAGASIPVGANWYSGYIYHHMTCILGESRVDKKKNVSGKLQKKVAVITFNRPFRAKGFLAFMEKKAPSVKLDMFRTSMGRFQVVMLYRHEADLVRGRKILKNYGFELALPVKGSRRNNVSFNWAEFYYNLSQSHREHREGFIFYLPLKCQFIFV